MTVLSEIQVQLLLTAERLFAREGVDAVSARRIALEAGHRNISATLYHFGSKERLIEALLAMRMRDLNRRREELLELLKPKDSIHVWLGALVIPLMEQLADTDSHFVGCIEQLYSRTFGDYLYADLDESLTSGLRRAVDGIVPLLGNLPTDIVNMRLHLMASQIIHSAADWYYQRERGIELPAIDDLTASLIEYVAGGLLAARVPIGSSEKNKHANARGSGVTSPRRSAGRRKRT